MNGIAGFGSVLLALSMFTASWAEQTNQPVRLAVDLVDGSHILGTPDIAVMPVRTSYAAMEIPLEEILAVKMKDDRGRATLEFENGDRVTGVMGLSAVTLETLFGRVSVGLAKVAGMGVYKGDQTVGLMLHYSFDDDEDGKVTDRSGRGNHGTVAGAVRYDSSDGGSAITISSRDTYVICNTPGVHLNGWGALTVSAWVRLTAYATYGSLVSRCLEGGEGGGFGLSVGGQYGGQPYDAGWSVAVADGNSVGVRVPRFAELNRWYHVAGTYDGRCVRYYVNGEEAASQEVAAGLENAFIRDSAEADLIIGKSAGQRSWYDTHINGVIDDVMIFNRALDPAAIERLCRLQRK